MLYPYRPSSVKNRQRWNFGVVYPRNYSEAQQGTDPWCTRTECLVKGGAQAGITVKVRFLQAISRTVGDVQTPLGNPAERSDAELPATPAWQEAAERDAIGEVYSLDQLSSSSLTQLLHLTPREATEPILDSA